MREHWHDTLGPALVQHLELTAIAIAIGFTLAFALALLAHRQPRVEHPSESCSALLYTIPSLALFQLLVPFTGNHPDDRRDRARLVHARDPLPEHRRGAAERVRRTCSRPRDGMGLTRRQVLMRIELPLAVPAIIGGLRVAVVSTISIATIAAFLLPEGLGYPIFLALKEPTPFKTEIYSAGAARRRPGARVRPDARRDPARSRPLEPRVTLADAANLHTFVDAVRFIGDHPGFLATKALEQLELSARHSASRCSSPCRSASSSGIAIAAPHSRSGHRSSAGRCRASC